MSAIGPTVALCVGFGCLAAWPAGAAERDSDRDGLPDAWEEAIVAACTSGWITAIDHVSPRDDFDFDGVKNADEYRFNSDPTDDQSVPPYISFETSQMVVSEAGTNVPVTVGIVLSQAVTADVSARVYCRQSSAEYPSDHTFTNRYVSFAPGETHVSFTFEVISDEHRQVLEPDESLLLKFDRLKGPAIVWRHDRLYVQIKDYATDTDGDRLPDWWENKYFGDPVKAAPEDDPDSDKWNNLLEYIRGGNPLRPWVPDTNNVLKLRVFTPLRKKKRIH